jgi:D-specific alpha-keto acid dehydrogenase
MTGSESPKTATPGTSVPSPTAVATTGVTIFGCAPDEAVLFEQLAPIYGFAPVLIEEELSAANTHRAEGHRSISVSHRVPVTPPVLQALSSVGVKYVSTRSIGFDHIDLAFAESLGISVENVAYSPDAVADYTLMMILMALRSAKSTVLRAEAHDFRLSDVRGRELRDLTVGVIGTGRIGEAVINRLRGFGGRILAHDPYPRLDVEYVHLDELLKSSDIVTLHTPLAPETHHLINAERITTMKDGAFVINTGRGAVIETEALIHALETGALGGAALDVVEGEKGLFYSDHRDDSIETTTVSRLQGMPNVLITPHTAFYTDHALSDAVENSLINCRRFESGEHHG